MGSYLNLELRLLPPNSDHPANHHHHTDNIVKTSPEEKSEKLTIFYDGIISSCEVTELQVKIQKESEVRLKIIGTRVDATEIFCIGTIKDDFLGVISDPSAAA